MPPCWPTLLLGLVGVGFALQRVPPRRLSLHVCQLLGSVSPELKDYRHWSVSVFKAGRVTSLLLTVAVSPSPS